MQSSDSVFQFGICEYVESYRDDVHNMFNDHPLVKTFLFYSWMKKTPSARAQSLYALAKGLEAKKKDLSASITSQTGLAIEEADMEVELSIARLFDWAALCDKALGGAPVRIILQMQWIAFVLGW